MRVLSLYIHVPFCTRRCSYCSFFHLPREVRLGARYVDALVDEIDASVPAGAVFGTVFLGGGTPSVLPRADLARVFDAIEAYVRPGVTTEVTCELNPEDVDAGLLDFLRGRGVNRVSLGVQSMDASSQRVLKRCPPEVNRRALSLALNRFENVSADVLLGVPGGSVEAARATLRELTEAGPAHFSVYCLEPGGDMGAEVESFFAGVDPDRSADEYLMACEELAARGYRHYEVSNFARPGFESAHNRVYWNGGDYLGVGPGAHSSLGGRRFHNAPSLEDYLAYRGPRRDAARVEDDAAADVALERAMLALRTGEGMPLSWARCRPETIDAFVAEGLARREDGRLVLTDRGFLVTNDVVLRVCAATATHGPC